MAGISVVVAIIVGLISSFVQSLGLTIQRKSHVQDELKPLQERRRAIRRPLWLLGFSIYMTSNIFSTIFQLDTLPIVILAPLGAISLIFNALLARLILGDMFGPASIMGTALVAVGAVLIAVFGVVDEKEHSLDDLLELWARPAFLAFFGVVAAVTVLVLVAAHVTAWHVSRQILPGRIALPGRDTPPLDSLPPSNYASPRDPPPIPFHPTSRRWSSPVTASTTHIDLPDDHKPGVRFSNHKTSISPQGLSIQIPPPDLAIPNEAQQRTLTLTGLAFAAASGTLSGMSLVLAKAAVELLVITIDHFRTGRGANEFVRVQSWFLVAGLLTGGLLQLVYLNYSLTFASPALICPLAFCFFNLSSIFDGLVFYDQFGRLRPHQIALVFVGVVVLFLGVWVVSAIQPTGQGGVDVGTWVGEDEELEMATDQSPLLGGDDLFEPAEIESDPIEHPHPQTPITNHSTRFSNPSSPSSPMSPMSPTTRARIRHRGPRYGTLIPELVHPGAPTGFSIGLGAASPGFVLRPGSMSIAGEGDRRGSGAYRRVRSRSEGQPGLGTIMRGEVEEEGRRENQVERTLREWERPVETGQSREGWWRRFRKRKEGRIRLDEEGDGG